MNTEKLNKIIAEHLEWLNDDDGNRANLSEADLRWAYLSEANLSGADLSEAGLRWAYLSEADLSGADLSGADLSGADLSGADLSGANLSGAGLRWANLSEADLSGANLSGAKDIAMQSVFIQRLERDDRGFIAYKTFGEHYSKPDGWQIEPGAVITENCNTDRTHDCACGINVATLDWVCENTRGDIWKVRIPFGALIIVPYNSDGKFRTEMCELIEQIER